MHTLLTTIESVLVKNALLTAFAVVGVIVWASHVLSARLTRGRVHGSAIAIAVGLLLASYGGWRTGGSRGLADLPLFAGLGVMGGAMLRDLAIVATAFGTRLEVFRRSGLIGAVALGTGLLASFVVGCTVAYAAGYRDPESITTLGAGAATYIVGPVTGTAIGASSEVIALSIGAGLVKAILVMILTPLVANSIGLDNPRAAMIFGGLMGTSSGVVAGLAATDERLVPYGAMTATFYTGLGCLVGPSLVYLVVRACV